MPRPYAVSENAILMAYVGDGGRAAPTLHETDIDPREATRLFDVVMDNVERMMRYGVIHGDLSAYNILYWEGDITLIDFPQVTDIHANPHAGRILQRDLRRVRRLLPGARRARATRMRWQPISGSATTRRGRWM